MTTAAPACASAKAVARPMPDPPPVTTAILSLKSTTTSGRSNWLDPILPYLRIPATVQDRDHLDPIRQHPVVHHVGEAPQLPPSHTPEHYPVQFRHCRDSGDHLFDGLGEGLPQARALLLIPVLRSQQIGLGLRAQDDGQ